VLAAAPRIDRTDAGRILPASTTGMGPGAAGAIVVQRKTSTAAWPTHRVPPPAQIDFDLSAVSRGVVNELVELYAALPADTANVFGDLETIIIEMAVALEWMESRKLSNQAEARLILIMLDAVQAIWSAVARFPEMLEEPGYLSAVYAKWERKFMDQMLLET
jgi:hypothetical protein